MIKSPPLTLSLILITFSGEIYAQYTQMIVDNNNRVMPIFFHDDINQQPIVSQPNHYSAPLTTQIYRHPKPVALSTNRKQAAAHQRQTQQRISQNQQTRRNMTSKQGNISRNPLKGPYLISPKRHRIMAAAHSALGIPYIYGGNNPDRGLDCSSLMQFIHKKALGVRIPRTAAQQRNRSKTVNYNNLQPGDMLFFKINRRSNHVGIYIGEGKFIHASSSNKRATIASMNLPYWKKRFVKFGSYLDS